MFKRLPQTHGKDATQILPPDLIDTLLKHFTQSRINYIASVLTIDEIKVVNDVKDTLIIARIKRMSTERLNHYNHWIPKDLLKYNKAQMAWFITEEYLVSARVCHKVTSQELSKDFQENKNGIRFRAYYCMKYPDLMKHNGKCNICISVLPNKSEKAA